MLEHRNSPPTKPQRVVILGARGFIGCKLLASLERAGIPTLPVSRSEVDLGGDHAGDELAAIIHPTDSVVILAALTPDKGRGIGPFLMNIQIAAKVCAALEKVTPNHVVYISSDAVYAMQAALVTEASCAEPPDLYGTMHLAREVMVKSSTSAPVAVLRPTLIYGPGDTHNSYGPNRFRRVAAKEGKITLFGQGEEVRDHIFVDDVVTLLLSVLSHRSSGRLNLATGCSVTFAELAEKIASLFDKPIDIVGTPRQNPITYRHFDVTALREAFPTFAFTSMEAGLGIAHREMREER